MKENYKKLYRKLKKEHKKVLGDYDIAKKRIEEFKQTLHLYGLQSTATVERIGKSPAKLTGIDIVNTKVMKDIHAVLGLNLDLLEDFVNEISAAYAILGKQFEGYSSESEAEKKRLYQEMEKFGKMCGKYFSKSKEKDNEIKKLKEEVKDKKLDIVIEEMDSQDKISRLARAVNSTLDEKEKVDRSRRGFKGENTKLRNEVERLYALLDENRVRYKKKIKIKMKK